MQEQPKKRSKLGQYIWNWLILIDQAFNVLLGGDPDETMSSRMGKFVERDKCKFCLWTCKFLNLFEDDHCAKSVERDRGKRTIWK